MKGQITEADINKDDSETELVSEANEENKDLFISDEPTGEE